MKQKVYFDDPVMDKRLRSFWKYLETSNHPFKGMNTKEILRKIRAN